MCFTSPAAFFLDENQRVTMLVLNPADPMAQPIALALRSLLSPWNVVIILGITLSRLEIIEVE